MRRIQRVALTTTRALTDAGRFTMTAANLAFDAERKEQALRAESQSWDTSNVESARAGDIPIIDVAEYFASGEQGALQAVAQQLREASREVGFYSLTGHSISRVSMDAAFAEVKRFHQLPLDDKLALRMDRADSPVGGAGYLPVKHRKLPKRATGNENEAFIVKQDRTLRLTDNEWPTQQQLPGFRDAMISYAAELQALALRLLPIYALSLNADSQFFAAAFVDPLFRLRMTHYPPSIDRMPEQFGIAPHVDTTFFTLLTQESPGLCVFSERRKCWISVPMIDGAIIVNSGELLKQWSNDEFLSAKHFANNVRSQASRYSIPFFFNANADYPMACIPSCCGPDRPAKYPTISYQQSQGVVQGE